MIRLTSGEKQLSGSEKEIEMNKRDERKDDGDGAMMKLDYGRKKGTKANSRNKGHS